MTTSRLSPDRIHAAVPPLSGTLTVPGLQDTVEILRDSLGIPHIRARLAADAFFGQGFAHAQDRLWQMECDRRRAQGRWAEYVGPVGVAQDQLMRRFRLAVTARSDYDQAPAAVRTMLDAYAAGVNAFLTSTDRLPAEFTLLGEQPEPWQPWDGMAIYKFRHVLMGMWEWKLLRARLLVHCGPEAVRALYPLGREGDLLILPPGATYAGPVSVALEELAAAISSLDWMREEDGGSNNWVVSGRMTASGKPLLAGDPHRAVDVPNVYYQNHVACDQFDVTGLSFPGLPAFPHFGHNDRVAWCITHTGADTQDLFIERFDPADPSWYLFQGEWRRAEVAHEEILVRGGDPVDLEMVTTHHGPVVAGNPRSGHALTLQYTATLPQNRGWSSLLPMLSARSVAELDAAVADWVDPVNNLLYADVDGNIGYRMRGLLPIRHPLNALLPVPGWTGEHDWTGMVPFAELPHQVNPENGYIVTANNRIVGPDYPHYIALLFAADFRARRITEMLQGRTGLTVADMAAIHADVTSLPARQLARLLGRVGTRTEAGAQAKALLAGWDGRVVAKSPAAAIYEVFRNDLTVQVLRPILGPLVRDVYEAGSRSGPPVVTILRQRIFSLIESGDTSLLPPGATWDALLTEALERSVVRLTAELGPDMSSWRWGRLHQLRPVHPLAVAYPEARLLQPAPSPMDGDGDCVQASGYAPAGGFAVSGTAVARYVFDLGDWECSGWAVPHGASGHAGSRHFADQHAAWLAHTLHPMTFSWERLAATAQGRFTLCASPETP